MGDGDGWWSMAGFTLLCGLMLGCGLWLVQPPSGPAVDMAPGEPAVPQPGVMWP